MTSFFLKLGMFSLPAFLLGIVLPIYALWFIGEIKPIQQIAIEQTTASTVSLYNVRVDESGIYKQTVISERESEILMLGSSRVLTFRDAFCRHDPNQFYNAGIRTLDMTFMQVYAETFIEAYSPEVLILALDQPNFNAAYERRWLDISLQSTTTFDYQSELSALRYDLQEMVEELVSIDPSIFGRMFDRREPIYGHTAFGMDATLSGVGYRADGSFQYDIIEPNVNREAMRYRFDVPQFVFMTGNQVNRNAILSLETILQLAQSRDIEVVAFFPPFEPTTYETEIAQNPDGWRYLDLATSAVEDLFQDYGYTFYDFTDPTSLNINDDIMLDQWHLSERGSLLLFQELVAQHSELFSDCTTVTAIDQQLASTDHPWVIFEDTSDFQYPPLAND